MEASNLKVLAIDDNQENLTTLQAILAEWRPGARVMTALSGPTGLELARTGDPDVILLGIAMPGMDGYEVCRQLKADERLQSIPVLILTSSRPDRDGRLKALSIGAEGFLRKPFDDIDLVAQVQAMAKISAANRLRRIESDGLAERLVERTRALELELAKRKRAEEALSEREALLQESQIVAGLGSYVLDIQTGLWTSSEVLDRLFGIDRAYVRNVEGWVALIHADDQAMMADYLKNEILGLNHPFDKEYRIVRQDDRVERWVHGLGRLKFDVQGRPTQLHGTIQDVTRDRMAALALRESEAQFRAMVETLPLAIFLTIGREQITQYINPMMVKMFGYTREDLPTIGHWWSLAFPDETSRRQISGEWTIRIKRALETRSPIEPMEVVVACKDGSKKSILWGCITMADRSYSYGLDLTEYNRLAEEKTRLEDQLRQSQKVEAIGRLAGGVAHDFNNITAIILGYGELLQGQFGPADPSRKWVEQIVAAGRRSAALTRQLLAFSRKQALQPQVLDLNALLRNFEKMLGRVIGEDIELKFELAENLGRVKADPGQLEQVVTNLAFNARDAMPLGGRLTIATADVELDEVYALGHESVVPGRYVMLSLTDTGCGMDEATMARLFEPFFTTKPKGKGTGLGLATSYGIVKQSGGYIWGSSEPDKGATFKIYLPRTDGEVGGEKVGPVESMPRGNGELILLVEDVTPLRELCETVLTRLGYRVVAAANGLEALQLAHDQALAPDLVVTDVIMPGMSGSEMAQRLRRGRPGLPVLFMSGYPDEVVDPHGVLAAGTPFIQKPFTERALARKVREVLGEPGSGEQSPVAPPGRCVLMIDDDEQYRDLVRHFCTKRGHLFADADSLPAALAALAAQPCDVLLVDLNIPGTSGEHVLREIRAAGHTAPAIVLTGDIASADMDALRPLGAVRALEKSSSGEALLEALGESRQE